MALSPAAISPGPLPLAAFGRIDWCMLVLYWMGMAVIGHVVARQRTDAKGYFLGGRRTPTWAVVLSIVATSLSAATFLGAPQEAFGGDLTYFTLNLGGFLAVVVVAWLFIPRFYRAGTVTIYGFLRQRFGQGAVTACSAAFLFGRVLASGARLFIAATPVCLLLFRHDPPTRIDLIVAILLVGAIGVAYTVAGGIKAVIWTDSAQIVIVVGAALLSICLLLRAIPLSLPQIADLLRHADAGNGPGGGKLRVFDFSFDPTRKYTVWTALCYGTLLNMAAYGVDHDLVQRMLTARSALRGSASVVLAQVLNILVAGLFLVIGLLLYIYYRRPDVMGAAAPPQTVAASQQVYPIFLLNLPTGLAGLAMAGLFAAAQGSLDSAINAMASSAVADLYWPLRRAMGLPVDEAAGSRTPRVAVALMGAVLIGFAIASVFLFDGGKHTLLQFALDIMSFAYTGMLGVFLAALLTRRGSTRSVIVALLAGVAITALMQDWALPWWSRHLLGRELRAVGFWAMPVGTPVCFLICCAGVDKRQGNKVTR